MYIINGTVCRPTDPRPSLNVLLKCVVENFVEPRAPVRNRRIPVRLKNLIYYEIHSGQFTIAEVAIRNQVNKNTVVTIRDTWNPEKKAREDAG